MLGAAYHNQKNQSDESPYNQDTERPPPIGVLEQMISISRSEYAKQRDALGL